MSENRIESVSTGGVGTALPERGPHIAKGKLYRFVDANVPAFHTGERLSAGWGLGSKRRGRDRNLACVLRYCRAYQGQG